MAYISATTEFQQIIFILKFKHYQMNAIKMVGDFSPELPFKLTIVQSFYHKKGVNLGLIAREGFSNVSYIKKCALQHTKSLKESD